MRGIDMSNRNGTTREEPYQIEAVIYCKNCMREVRDNPEVTPGEYAAIEAGFTPTGFQVWCTRHERSIAHFEGVE